MCVVHTNLQNLRISYSEHELQMHVTAQPVNQSVPVEHVSSWTDMVHTFTKHRTPNGAIARIVRDANAYQSISLKLQLFG